MLKDLFFAIWHDDFGSGWMILITAATILSFGWIVYIIARTKALDKKLSKKSWFFIFIALFCMYQMIPVSLNLKAFADLNPVMHKWAIKTSIIPWQKGAYYCNLANTYFINKNGQASIQAYDNAYKYLKSYKYPCWGISFLNFYILGDYDKAVNAMNESYLYRYRKYYVHEFNAKAYIMKGDFESAMINIDKSLNLKESPKSLALKAYLEKRKGNVLKGEIYYKKALNLAENQAVTERVNRIYKDFLSYETNYLKEKRSEFGLE